jgi:trigger factor
MQTNLKQLNSVEYELEIEAPADAFASDIDKALRVQRAKTQMKGFRPGKVPIQLVKKLYGEAIAFGFAEKKVQEIYEEEILGSKEHDVLGRPRLTELEYALDGPLRAVVRFGVRPSFELADLSNVEIKKMRLEITDEMIDAQLKRVLDRAATLEELPEGEGLGEGDYAKVDMQPLDDETGTPIVGAREEGVTFFMDDERLKDSLREALLGKTEGDTARVEMVHEESHGHHEGAHTHQFEVTVVEAKKRIHPEIDEELVKKVTAGQETDEAGLRQFLERQLEEGWEQQSRELVESQVVTRMLELHTFEVPESVVEMYLDSFIEDVKERNEGKLPEGFDDDLFRQSNQPEAFNQAKWMLIRDRVINESGIELTDEDKDAELERNAAEMGVPADLLKRYYGSMPHLLEQTHQRALSRKVFSHLLDMFNVREYSQDELQAAREAEEGGDEEG